MADYCLSPGQKSAEARDQRGQLCQRLTYVMRTMYTLAPPLIQSETSERPAITKQP